MSCHIPLVFTVSLALVLSVSGLVLHGEKIRSVSTPTISWLSGESWMAPSLSGAIVSMKHPNVSGKIVFLKTERTWGYDAQNAYNRGAIGLVIRNPLFRLPGQLDYIRLSNIQGPKNSHIPSVEIGDEIGEFFDLLDKPINGSFPSLNVTIFDNDTNVWKPVNEVAFVVFSAIVGFLCLFAASMAGYKIFSIHNSATGIRMTLPMACLVIELFANTVRALYVIIDPLYSRRILTRPIHDSLGAGIPSLSFTTTVLFAFYWHAMIHNARALRQKASDKTKPFLIPSLFVLVFFVSVDITLGILYGFFESVLILAVAVVIILLSSLASSLYLLITGAIVYRRLQAIQSKSRTLKKIKIITLQLMSSAVFIAIYTIAAFFFISEQYRSPWGYYVVSLVYWIALTGISITQIAAIRKKSSNKQSSTSGPKTSSSINKTDGSSSLQYISTKPTLPPKQIELAPQRENNQEDL